MGGKEEFADCSGGMYNCSHTVLSHTHKRYCVLYVLHIYIWNTWPGSFLYLDIGTLGLGMIPLIQVP